MKTISSLVALSFLLATSQAIDLPTLSAELDADDVVLTWDASSLNPGSFTELFYGFQLERTNDLKTWLSVGNKIDTRINGGAQTHTVRVPLDSTGGTEYFRLKLFLDLAGQNLQGSDFSDVDFGNADLEGADLSGADLSGANLLNSTYRNIMISSLGGPGNQLVSDSLPAMAHAGGGVTFAMDAPDLDGVGISSNSFFLSFQADTTTAEANAILSQYGAIIVGGIPSGSPEIPSIFIVQLGVGGFGNLQTVLDALDLEEDVTETAMNVMLGLDAIPYDVFSFSDWNWDTAAVDPPLGNWGLRAAKIPQMWNFNWKIIQMQKAGTRPYFIDVGVLDGGMVLDSLDFFTPREIGTTANGSHGTHVCGIIATKFSFGPGNSVSHGIDGVNPFARLNVADYGGTITDPSTLGEILEADGETSDADLTSFAFIITGLNRMVYNAPDVSVINLSLGYGWHKRRDNKSTATVEDHSRDPLSDLKVQKLVESESNFRNLFWRIKNSFGYSPMIVGSAGNSSNFPNRRTPLALIPAKWNSPWNYASAVNGDTGVLTVEASQNVAEALYFHSCVSGNVRAPGQQILSTVWPNVKNNFAFHKRLTGTSMAAPHVTGVVSYMRLVEPTLTNAEIHDILTRHNGVATPSAILDGFGAVMDIDRVKGNTNVLKMLIDIDDGTVDGNQRVVRGADLIDADPRAVIEHVIQEPGIGETPRIFSIGDGVIDIKDFRCWRDWLLQYENGATASNIVLDGPPDHFKKDLNRNFRVLDMARENVFPRGDFNGDGKISRSRFEYVPGAIGDFVVDLEVLQSLYQEDEYWTKDDLFLLQDSFDLEISLYEYYLYNWENPDDQLTELFITFDSGNPGFKPGAYPIRVNLIPLAQGSLFARTSHLLLTLPTPPNRYRLQIIANTEGTATTYLSSARINAKPGEDIFVIPVPKTDF